MRGRHYQEYRHWSPLMGCEAARLSIVGGDKAVEIHGEGARTAEWYAIISADVAGRKYREARTAALDAIEEAIAEGEPPGEVTLPETVP
jgi:hypothetical protein